jgi:hypothetical protein
MRIVGTLVGCFGIAWLLLLGGQFLSKPPEVYGVSLGWVLIVAAAVIASGFGLVLIDRMTRPEDDDGRSWRSHR